MISYKFVLLAIIFIIAGLIPIVRNKFYKSEKRDMLWATGLGSFLSSILLLLFGLAVLVYELNKLF